MMRDLKPGDRVMITGPQSITSDMGAKYIGQITTVGGFLEEGTPRIKIDGWLAPWCRENLRALPRPRPRPGRK